MDTEDGILGTNMYAYCQNDPVMLVDPSGTDPVDITIRLWATMITNHQELSSYLYDASKSNGAINGWLESVGFFVWKVRPGGDWDLKNLPEWQLMDGDWFVFHGVRLRHDDIGNIHYGFVGSVLFPEGILVPGSGAAQVLSDGFSPRRTVQWGNWRTWFDDPRDIDMTRIGSRLHDFFSLNSDSIMSRMKMETIFHKGYLSNWRPNDILNLF